MAKLEAAAFAAKSGVDTIIASGKTPDVISKIVNGQHEDYTLVKAQCTKKESRKNWLQAQVKAKAAIIVDGGAERALLTKGCSLLPSGITSLKGKFDRGDIVNIEGPTEKTIGIGQINYSSQDVQLIKGCHSSDIAEKLQNPLEDEVIHRDNMVIFS